MLLIPNGRTWPVTAWCSAVSYPCTLALTYDSSPMTLMSMKPPINFMCFTSCTSQYTKQRSARISILKLQHY